MGESSKKIVYIYYFSLSLYSHFKLLQWEWTAYPTTLTYSKYRAAWLAFRDLLHLGAPIENNFICHICGNEPRVVVCDGMTLSMQTRYVRTLVGETSEETTLLMGSR